MRTLTLLVGLAVVACGGTGRKDRPTRPAVTRTEAQELEGDPDNPELAVAMAELLVEGGADTNAVPIIRGALAKYPKDARLHYLMGCVLRDRGVYRQAELELKLALELMPSLSPAESALGILLDLQGQHEAARAHHLRALELDPKVPRYHNNLGFSRYLSGDQDGAVRAYEEALRLDPTATSVYVNLGFALAAQGKDDEAVRMFRQTLTEAEALNNVALAHELRGNPAVAREKYKEALLLQPGLSQAVENLEALEAAKQPAAPKQESP